MRQAVKSSNLNKIVRFGWRSYKILALFFFTGFIILLFLAPILEHLSYVELPNGLKLTQSFFRDIGKNGFVLKKADGSFVLAVKSGELAWQGDYVFGMAEHVTSGEKEGDRFVYKQGWDEPIIYTYNFEPEDYLEKYNLRGSIDYSPELFQNKEHEDCLRFNGMSECKFRILNQYWWDVEDGKRRPYQCRKNDPTETCHSYNIYKTYLSLIKIPRYRRG